MVFLFLIFFIVYGVACFIILIEFLVVSFFGERVLNGFWTPYTGIISAVLAPVLFYSSDFGQANVMATWSAGRTALFYLSIGVGLWAFFNSVFRKEIKSPLREIWLNWGLVVGVILNVLLLFYDDFVMGSLPIILIFLTVLIDNQMKLKTFLLENNPDVSTKITIQAERLLKLKAVEKYPILFFFLLPLFVLATSVLMLNEWRNIV